MSRLKLFTGVLLLTLAGTAAAQEGSPLTEFQEAERLEESGGKTKAALAIYQRIAAQEGAPLGLRARALYRVGVCQEKLGQRQAASRTYKKVVSECRGLGKLVRAAEEAIDRLERKAEQPKTPIAKKAADGTITMQFTDANVRTVLLHVAAFGKINICLSPDVRGSITLDVTGLKPLDAIRLVTRTVGDYAVIHDAQKNYVRVAPRSSLETNLILRAYPLIWHPPTPKAIRTRYSLYRTVAELVTAQQISGTSAEYDPPSQTLFVCSSPLGLQAVEKILGSSIRSGAYLDAAHEGAWLKRVRAAGAPPKLSVPISHQAAREGRLIPGLQRDLAKQAIRKVLGADAMEQYVATMGRPDGDQVWVLSTGTRVCIVDHVVGAVAGPRLRAPAAPAYEGPPVTTRFHDANVRTVLELIAAYSGTPLILSGEVRGAISLSLENVPFRFALREVVATTGDYVVIETPAATIVTSRSAAETWMEIQRWDLLPTPREYWTANDKALIGQGAGWPSHPLERCMSSFVAASQISGAFFGPDPVGHSLVVNTTLPHGAQMRRALVEAGYVAPLKRPRGKRDVQPLPGGNVRATLQRLARLRKVNVVISPEVRGNIRGSYDAGASTVDVLRAVAHAVGDYEVVEEGPKLFRVVSRSSLETGLKTIKVKLERPAHSTASLARTLEGLVANMNISGTLTSWDAEANAFVFSLPQPTVSAVRKLVQELDARGKKNVEAIAGAHLVTWAPPRADANGNVSSPWRVLRVQPSGRVVDTTNADGASLTADETTATVTIKRKGQPPEVRRVVRTMP